VEEKEDGVGNKDAAPKRGRYKKIARSVGNMEGAAILALDGKNAH
jgi:hypothetical protein